jgi:S-adenosylhomocysteine hydrolase
MGGGTVKTISKRALITGLSLVMIAEGLVMFLSLGTLKPSWVMRASLFCARRIYRTDGAILQEQDDAK